jgi:uncharacterized RDD family membrane protein YckC
MTEVEVSSISSANTTARMITCQHCQTWILDGEYRCNRCGRRVRSTPLRSASSHAYPVTTTAAAPAYAFQPVSHAVDGEPEVAHEEQEEQSRRVAPQPLHCRVIPFDSLNKEAERESIRARAAELARPAPLKTETVQVKHARAAKVRSGHGRKLEFMGQAEVLTPPQSHIICDAPVAPAPLRLEAALIDAAIMAVPCLISAGLFWCIGGKISLDKHIVPFLLMAIATVPLLYKLLWVFAGCDTIGMRQAGLQLVDFDGNPPSKARRYQRLLGSTLSFLAAGIGLIWSLVDEDRLTWHDHISGTFPTIASED